MYNSELLADIETGSYTLSELAEKYNTTIRKVRTMKDSGAWYTDLETGELVGCSFKISEEQQYYYVIRKFMEMYEDTQITHDEKAKIIAQKSLNVRIATFLNINPRTTSRWNDKRPLVSEGVYSIQSFLFSKYLEYQNELMGEFFDVDREFIRGHKLYYVNYGQDDGFTYYINQNAFKYYESENKDEKTFIDRAIVIGAGSDEKGVNPYVVILSAKTGIQLAKWIESRILEGYTYEECKRCLRALERFTEREYEGRLNPPETIYYETRGFILLANVYKYRILGQLERGEIAGTFKYNPMDLEIWKLEYG